MENDRRTRRTKNLLKRAYIELLAEKKFNEISVKELCDIADINRGTFYLHYSDIYDLKTQLEDEIIEQLENLITTHSSLKNSNDTYLLFLDLFYLVLENKSFFSAFLGNNGDISYFQRMQTVFKERYFGILLRGKTPNDSVRFNYSYDFISSGFTGLLGSWLTTPVPPSPEEMALLLNRIICEGLPSLLSFL